jgi:hypothetical protein
MEVNDQIQAKIALLLGSARETHCIGGCVGPRIAPRTKKIMFFLGIKARVPDHPPRYPV